MGALDRQKSHRWDHKENGKVSRQSSQGSEPKPCTMGPCSQQRVGPREALGYGYWMSTGGMGGKEQMARK